MLIIICVLQTSCDYFWMKKMFYFKNGQINVFFNFSLIWPFFMIRFENFQHCANFAILPLYNFTEFRYSLVNISSPLTDCKIDFIIWPKKLIFLISGENFKKPKISFNGPLKHLISNILTNFEIFAMSGSLLINYKRYILIWPFFP